MTINTTSIKSVHRYKTLEQDFNTVHNYKYDYSKSVFEGMNKPISIICPIHGMFTQRTSSHLVSGCPHCGGTVKLKQEEFVEKCKQKHKNRYLYNNLIYTGNKNHIIVTCRIHGDFKSLPLNHLYKGKGCRKCDNIRKTRTKYSNEEFIEKAINIHKNLYRYTEVNYINSKIPVTIYCTSCSTNFSQAPNKHLQGHGCSSCCGRGFDMTKPGLLYYLKVEHNNITAYKIGITNYSVLERYRKGNDINKISILYEEWFGIGKDAYTKEQQILKDCRAWKYYGPDLLESGNSELFSEDIMYK